MDLEASLVGPDQHRPALDSVVTDFCYREVGTWAGSRRSDLGSLVRGAALHLLILLWPVIDIVLTPIPAIKITMPRAPLVAPLLRAPVVGVIRLVRAEPEVRKPADLRPIEQKTTSAPVEIKPFETYGSVPTKAKGRIAFRFVLDREQLLPKVLSHQNGSVGFGHADVVRQQFRAPGWTAVVLPREGVALNGFYYLMIDESTGPYTFVEQLRQQDTSLRQLQPYALFGFEFQAQVEEAIANAAIGRCLPSDDLRALVRLDAVADIRIEEVQCLKK